MFHLIQLINEEMKSLVANGGAGDNESSQNVSNLNTSNGNPNHSVNKVSSNQSEVPTPKTTENGAEDTLRVDSLAENQIFDEESNSAHHVKNNYMNEHDPKQPANVVFIRSSGLQKRPAPVAGPSGLQQQQQLGTGSKSQEIQVDLNQSADHENSARISNISSKRGSALYDNNEYEDSSDDESPNNHLANKSFEPQRKRKKRLGENSNIGKYLCSKMLSNFCCETHADISFFQIKIK